MMGVAIVPGAYMVASVAGLFQAAPAVDSIHRLATAGFDSALSSYVAERPDEAREALRQLLIGSTRPVSTVEQRTRLTAAERVAAAFAVSWEDSFLVTQVTWFRARAPQEQRTWAQADSIHREGVEAAYRDGPEVAVRHWRESLHLRASLHDSAGVAASLASIGGGLYLAGELDSASIYLERARRVADLVGDHRIAGNAVVNLGSILYARGDLRRATERYEEALTIHRGIGDARGMAADYNNLGLIAEDLGDLEAARDAYEAALALNRKHAHSSSAADNLLNLGNIESTEANYARASARYRQALAIYRQLDEPLNEALVLHNLGLLNVRRGDYPGAARQLSNALEFYQGMGETEEAISTGRALADVHAAMGDLQTAVRMLHEAETFARSDEMATRFRAGLALSRADLAVRFNRLADAERDYALARRLYREDDNPTGQAEAQQGQGVLLLMRGDYADAREMLELALRTQQRSGNTRSAAWTNVLTAIAKEELGDTTGARLNLEEAVQTFRHLRDATSEAAALGALGDLQRRAGMTLAAESSYHRGLRLISDRIAPAVVWRLHAGLGTALAGRNAQAEAAHAFQAAIDEIEGMSGTLVLEERRAAFLADKWDVYAELALVERRRGRHAAAFEISERMRARQMLDLVARGRIAGAPSDSELREREHTLRRRVAELTGVLMAPTTRSAALRGPDLSGRDPAVLREALTRAQQEYAKLLPAIRESAPAYATLVTGEIASTPAIRRRLDADRVLLEYLLTDSTSVVFVVTRDTVVSLDLNVGRQSIARLVDFARGTLLRPERERPGPAWPAALRRLYDQLVAPVETAGLLRGKRRLLIVPHAELHYLPFEALLVSDSPLQFLIDRYDVAYAPSGSVWVQLGERARSSYADRVLALAPRVDALPGSREEVEEISRIYGDRMTALIGSAATEEAFSRAASDHGILHFATYGILNKHNPLFSFVELTADRGNDGRLEVHEVFGLDLSARLVVLSACQTALGSGALADVPPGDDWVGLVRAFLYAGTSQVIAALWPAEDRATADLMKHFYHHLEAGHAPSVALARAKRALIHDQATAHPFYWAGFVAVGTR
jgi:CHAT domain-containing protein/tetratricopeptide (TPR) repeat protein